MRLPYVSRRAYDVLTDRLLTAESALRQCERRLSEALQDAQKERDALMARHQELALAMGSMVREGLSVPPKLPELPQPDPLPAAIEKAINTVAPQGNDPVRRDLERLAWSQLAEQVEPETVAARILEGEEVAL